MWDFACGTRSTVVTWVFGNVDSRDTTRNLREGVTHVTEHR
jgi:hypothetical protein